jgi:hypothetical protein
MHKKCSPIEKARRDQRAALFQLFFGVLVALASLWAGIAVIRARHKIPSRWSADAPERVRQSILEAGSTPDGIQRMADHVATVWTEEAEFHRHDAEDRLISLSVFVGFGVLTSMMALKIRRYAAAFEANTSKQESSDSSPPRTAP